jgi:hypothetical protein
VISALAPRKSRSGLWDVTRRTRCGACSADGFPLISSMADRNMMLPRRLSQLFSLTDSAPNLTQSGVFRAKPELYGRRVFAVTHRQRTPLKGRTQPASELTLEEGLANVKWSLRGENGLAKAPTNSDPRHFLAGVGCDPATVNTRAGGRLFYSEIVRSAPEPNGMASARRAPGSKERSRCRFCS